MIGKILRNNDVFVWEVSYVIFFPPGHRPHSVGRYHFKLGVLSLSLSLSVSNACKTAASQPHVILPLPPIFLCLFKGEPYDPLNMSTNLLNLFAWYLFPAKMRSRVSSSSRPFDPIGFDARVRPPNSAFSPTWLMRLRS